jgi:hypothetical protein
MAGLDPAIHVFAALDRRWEKLWDGKAVFL